MLSLTPKQISFSLFLYLLRHDPVLLLKNISQFRQPSILMRQVGIQFHYCFFHQ